MFGRLFNRRQSIVQNTAYAYTHGNQNLIELHNVVKSYETAAGEFMALRGIDLSVDKSEFVAVIGKSGSGKSTLINMVTGIDRPSSGEVLIGDTAVQKLNEGQIAVWRGKNVGVVFQFFQLLPTLTVIENVMLPMDFCNTFPGRERKDRAMHLLEQVEMTDHADKLPTAISGGQQQRVAIARSLANDPPIIVADEPTGNLDSKTADSVFSLFEELVSSGKTILMVTHDEDLAERVTRTITIADGEIVEDRGRITMEEATIAPASSPPPVVSANGQGAPNTIVDSIIQSPTAAPVAAQATTEGQAAHDADATAPSPAPEKRADRAVQADADAETDNAETDNAETDNAETDNAETEQQNAPPRTATNPLTGQLRGGRPSRQGTDDIPDEYQLTLPDA